MPPEPQRKDTPAEGMPAVQHVSEADDHFVVTFADGKSTVVPKDGLKADTLAHIQGMAHGGEVRALAGGRIDPGGANDDNPPDVPDGALTDDQTREPHFPRMSRPAVTLSEQDYETPREEEPVRMADGGQVPDAGTQQEQFSPTGPPLVPFNFTPGGAVEPSIWEKLNGAPPEISQLFELPPVKQAMQYLQNNTPATSPGGKMLGAVGFAPPPGGTFDPITGSRIGPSGAEALGPSLQRGMIDLRSAPTPTAPAAQPAGAPDQPRMPGFGGSGALTELNRGLEEQRAGLAAQVETEKQRDAALMQLQDRHIAQMQTMEAEHAEQAALHQRRADDLFQATLNAKIDPNRVWATADIGQRVAAGIGILLSGIGSGMGGGPNMALQVIDRTIDRDIDAQKSNLETQKGLLSYYLQQGRDMMSAHQLAKADLKDMLAAQVTLVSASFGGQEAAARAQMVGGQLRTEAAGKRQEIMARDFQMQTQRAALGMEMEKNRLMSGYAAMGRAGQAGMLELMPKDTRERTVKRPDGSIGIAADDTAAKKYREASQATDKMRRTLQRYRAVLDSGHPWVPSGAGGDRQTAKALRAELILNLKDMNTLGALQPGELALIEPMVPDITDTFTRDKTLNQGMDALGYTIEDRVNSNLQAFLE